MGKNHPTIWYNATMSSHTNQCTLNWWSISIIRMIHKKSKTSVCDLCVLIYLLWWAFCIYWKKKVGLFSLPSNMKPAVCKKTWTPKTKIQKSAFSRKTSKILTRVSRKGGGNSIRKVMNRFPDPPHPLTGNSCMHTKSAGGGLVTSTKNYLEEGLND